MNRNVLILIFVLIAVAGVLVWNGTNRNAAENKPGAEVTGSPADDNRAAAPKKGSLAPALNLSSLDGSSSYKVEGKRDKVLIINFWAAWCGPCELEAPDLRDIYDKYKDKLDLYAVNATNFDNVRDAKLFVKEQKFVFPVLTDAKGKAGEAYKVYAYPTSFIVDMDGVIRQRIDGVISREQWQKYLQELL
ncbi:hypothetical protein SD71_04345 [Cohnella kolymensis]|uniref:Thioredoxin domain-containing protein n=1 Tax=Cohnella kolymensis TaxID=1590652 RepID=A0ABR5A7E6_9BACL|nr:TlpA disulfide reductase family protein [Cohnella kolymensis]KIL36949.1 hypothetical protein SD71_04345 [Cohnella kolymensis]